MPARTVVGHTALYSPLNPCCRTICAACHRNEPVAPGACNRTLSCVTGCDGSVSLTLSGKRGRVVVQRENHLQGRKGWQSPRRPFCRSAAKRTSRLSLTNRSLRLKRHEGDAPASHARSEFGPEPLRVRLRVHSAHRRLDEVVAAHPDTPVDRERASERGSPHVSLDRPEGYSREGRARTSKSPRGAYCPTGPCRY